MFRDRLWGSVFEWLDAPQAVRGIPFLAGQDFAALTNWSRRLDAQLVDET